MTAVYQLDVLQSVSPTGISVGWQIRRHRVARSKTGWSTGRVELEPAQRTGISLPPPSVGPHQLELVLRPTTREEPGERSLRFGVLPVARAQMQIEVPFGAPGIQIPSASARCLSIP